MKAPAHVACGAAAGLALTPWYPSGGPIEAAAWVAACAGAALLPDLDMPGSTAARTWGPVTGAAARVVGWAARGHRWGTHDALLGPGVAAAAVWAATWHPWAAMAVLALVVGLALRGLHDLVPGRLERTPLGNLALSWGAAWLYVGHADATIPAWLPAAVAAGMLAHIAGDALTPERVPVPLVWLWDRRARVGLPILTTSGWAQDAVAAAALTCAAATAYLA